MIQKQFYSILCALVGLLTISAVTQAQQIPIPFLCGFEEQSEVNQWQLNEGTPNANDQWVIGKATHSEGKQALYISSDGGSSTVYGDKPNIVMAYRVITFPKTGRYNITFDWKSIGNEQDSRLYVYFGPKQALTGAPFVDKKGNGYGLLGIVSETSGKITQESITMEKIGSAFDGTNTYKELYGNKKWQNYMVSGPPENPSITATINNAGLKKEWILAFVWVNNNKDADACMIGACIDNIQIASATISRPANLQAEMRCEDSTLMLTWESSSAFHNIEYKSVNEDTWHKLKGRPAQEGLSQKDSISFRQEGKYNIRVQGFNASRTDTSAYATLNNIVFWCPENHCINYIDLEGPDTECRYGDGNGWPVCDSVGCIGGIAGDEESVESRHVVNWIEDRYDPNTVGAVDAQGNPVPGLLTIPADSAYLASVRIGNWHNNRGRESITYTFVADSFTQAILIMKYAIVFEDPSHSGDQDFFRLEVLDTLDRQIDPDCGVASFTFDDASEWNNAGKKTITKQGGGTRTSNDIYWKDWTSIGLNLKKYHGRTLKVRVSVGDCGLSGHFGYAYFVLDCVSAKLESDNCGDNSEVRVNAPEGFDYTWYDSQGNIVGNEKTLHAKAGHEVYTCEACMREIGCCFSLSTALDPRYPVPAFDYEYVSENCKSYVQFYNRSHVMTIYDGVENHTGEACDQIQWNLTYNGGTMEMETQMESPRIPCPVDGDTIDVTLRAVIGGGACDSVLQVRIPVPSILTPDSIINESLCEGNTRLFGGQGCKETGTYYDRYKNISGCDSILELRLTVYPKSPVTYIKDTVCSSDLPYQFNGYSYPQSGNYSQDMKNIHECDSVVNLSLWVIEKLNVDVAQLPTLCADDGQLVIDYAVLHSRYDSLAIRFTSTTPQDVFYNQVIYDTLQTQVVYPFDVTTLPNKYHVQLEFYQHQSCGNQIFDLDFELQYRSSLIEQKWNDVLAILNDKYNGSYTFTSYQWYKNGMPLVGETNPYLYQSLDVDADYSVMLTRPDGTSVRTCPFRPTLRVDKYPFPTLAAKGQLLPVRRSASGVSIVSVRIFTMMGVLYSSTAISNGEGIVEVPVLEGNYLVELIDADGNTTTQHLIVVQ